MNEIIAKVKRSVLGDKESWLHTFGHSWRILLILVVAFILYRAFAPNKTTVHVGSGGTAIINQARKRFMIPFIEGGVEKNTAGHRDFDSYIRCGLRFEF